MMSRNFKKNRSDRYQWILLETPCSPDMLMEFADYQGVSGYTRSKNNEEKFVLKEQLKEAFWEIVENQLTVRQKEILRLSADGYTQIEIAKKLKVNQSSITKSINGNCDYRNGKRVYGGAKKKLRKIIAKDLHIQDILKQLEDLEDEY